MIYENKRIYLYLDLFTTKGWDKEYIGWNFKFKICLKGEDSMPYKRWELFRVYTIGWKCRHFNYSERLKNKENKK